MKNLVQGPALSRFSFSIIGHLLSTRWRAKGLKSGIKNIHLSPFINLTSSLGPGISKKSQDTLLGTITITYNMNMSQLGDYDLHPSGLYQDLRQRHTCWVPMAQPHLPCVSGILCSAVRVNPRINPWIKGKSGASLPTPHSCPVGSEAPKAQKEEDELIHGIFSTISVQALWFRVSLVPCLILSLHILIWLCVEC